MNKYKYARHVIDIIDDNLMGTTITIPDEEDIGSWCRGFNDCIIRVRNILKEKRDVLLMFENKKVGRPKLPDEERKSETIRVRLTEEEKKRIEMAAEEENVTVSDYLRCMITKELEEKLSPYNMLFNDKK